MTTTTRAAAAAGLLAIGILVGAAGTIVARDATSTDHMRDLSGMMSMMGAGDMSGMMSMMGGSAMGPKASMTRGDHESHHATPSPEATR